MKVRIMLCILLLLTAVFVGSGCGRPTEEGGTTTPSSETETDAPGNGSFALFRDGVAARIVYPLEAKADELAAVDRLAGVIRQLTGVTPEIADDYLRAGASYDSKTPEILLGLTGYEESRTVYGGIGYGFSEVRIVGNKLVIAGEDYDKLIAKLVITFKKAQDADKNILLEPALRMEVKGVEVLRSLPRVPNAASPTVINNDEGCYQLTFSDRFSAEAYQSYLELLESNGFVLYVDNTVGKNRFHIYTNDSVVVTTAYTHTRCLTILAEPKDSTDLTLLKRENRDGNALQKPVDSTFTMLGLLSDHTVDSKGYLTSDTTNGMSFIVRLEDGSFLINDGGHGSEWNADRLYAVLRKQAPDPDNIVIAAWILTHAHSDHVGILTSFGQKYASAVTVEHLIFNFPHPDMTARADCGDSKASAMLAIQKYFRGVPVTSAHAGHIFYIRNARVTILNTVELMQAVMDIYTLSERKWYYNDCSLNYMLELEDRRILILGDAGSRACLVLGSLYGPEELHCDIVQAAHHGVNGADETIYRVIAPEYAVIPVGGEKIYYTNVWIDIRTHVIGGYSVNGYLFDTCGEDKVLLAEDKVTVFLLQKDGLSFRVYDTVEAYQAS